MSKSSFQRGKILYLLELLKRESDEDHPLSMKQILASLEQSGIVAERKSIYSDIEVLRQMGYDIECRKGKGGGYCLLGGEFELPELKLLVDAVQASKFITEKKSLQLIRKLEKLTNRYRAGELRREVTVNGRIKAMNESIYYNVDEIHRAMQSNLNLKFHYAKWNVKKELELRRGGDWYVVSPWTLVWTDENYYMIGYDRAEETIKYYRVDKMRDIVLDPHKRTGKEEFEKIDMSQFAKQTFGMFGGEAKRLTLRCENRMAGVILDRFGTDIPMHEEGDEFFCCHVNVNVSPQFFGWLTGVGSGIQIVHPAEIKEEYQKYLVHVLLKNFGSCPVNTC